MTENRKAAERAAEDEGLLDPAVRALPLDRWPTWARIRYAGDEPASGPERAVDPLRVEDVKASDELRRVEP